MSNYALVVLVDNDVEHVIIINEDLKRQLPEIRNKVKAVADDTEYTVPRLQAVEVDAGNLVVGLTVDEVVQAITEHW